MGKLKKQIKTYVNVWNFLLEANYWSYIMSTQNVQLKLDISPTFSVVFFLKNLSVLNFQFSSFKNFILTWTLK